MPTDPNPSEPVPAPHDDGVALTPKQLARQARRAKNREEWARRRRLDPSALPPEVPPSVPADGPASVDEDDLEPESYGTPAALMRLFGRATKGVARIVDAPVTDRSVTNRDRLDAFAALRIAVGVGKELPPAETFHLPMGTLLGPTESTEAALSPGSTPARRSANPGDRESETPATGPRDLEPGAERAE